MKQSPPLPVTIEAAAGAAPDLGERLRARLRQRLVVATAVTVVPAGTLPRSDYKSKLVDWSEAAR